MSAFKISALFLAVFVSAAPVGAAVDASIADNKNGKSVTKSRLSDSELKQAELWQLSEDEYERFKDVMKSPRGYFTPNIDKNPLLALALESNSELERQKYAERWVQIQYDNNVKVISWQLDVDQAWNKLYPGVPRFSYKNPGTAHYAISNQGKTTAQGQSGLSRSNDNSFISGLLQEEDKPRAQLYVSITGCSGCSVAFDKQYESLKAGRISGIDIHFIGDVSKKDIVNWAIANKLNGTDVNETRVITLNNADKSVSKVPYVEFN